MPWLVYSDGFELNQNQAFLMRQAYYCRRILIQTHHKHRPGLSMGAGWKLETAPLNRHDYEPGHSVPAQCSNEGTHRLISALKNEPDS